MTDNEIIKALELHASEKSQCIDCPYFYENECSLGLAKDVLDLINRQKAEIEALTEKLNATIAGQETLQKAYEALKADEEREHQYCKNVCEPRYKAEIERLKERDETAEKIIREQSGTILHLKSEVDGYSEKVKTYENVIKNTFLEKAGFDIDPLAEIQLAGCTMKKYEISNCGCDDTTIGVFELTEEQYEFLNAIFKNLNENSTYQCMPTIYVEEMVGDTE